MSLYGVSVTGTGAVVKPTDGGRRLTFVRSLKTGSAALTLKNAAGATIVEIEAHTADATGAEFVPPSDLADRIFGKTVNAGTTVATNGTFDLDASWAKGTGWTIGSGKASSSGAQIADSDLAQASIVVSGTWYRVTFTVSGYSAGNVTPVCGTQEGTDRAANGTFAEYVKANGTGFAIRADLDFVGSVDNILVEAVSGDEILEATAVTNTWLLLFEAV